MMISRLVQSLTAGCSLFALSATFLAATAKGQAYGSQLQPRILFNFTDPATDLDGWVESSDTVRDVGMSKASFVIQQTRQYRRAIFFALLNPQANGACFAGFRTESIQFDPSHYQAVQLRLRNARGDLTRYKVNLNHGAPGQDGQRSYEIFFDISDLHGCTPATERCEMDVTLPLADFRPLYRGAFDPNAPPLNSAAVRRFGIQAAGGVYEEEKQSGAGAIEIDWIKLI